MKYKAIFLDVDGTLVVNSKDAIPTERVTTAINSVSSKLHVSLATGRPLFIAEPIIRHLQLSGPCIVNDGTQIFDPITNRIIDEIVMNPADVAQTYGVLKRHNVKIFVNDGIDEFAYDGSDRTQKKTLGLFVPELTRVTADVIIEELHTMSGIKALKGVDWTKEREYVVVCDQQATKLAGIQKIARMFGIQTHEIIGVGDGYNDFPLLMACGLKIAMGNAVPELKAIADFIAPSVEEDGVATVIEKFILAG